MMMINKEKPTYSLFSNIIFLFGLQWKYSKLSFVFLLLLIPMTLGLSFCGIYLPKLVVIEVLSDATLTHMVVAVGGIGLIIAVLNISSQMINTYNFALMTKFRTSIIFQKTLKTLYTDYENIESSKCRTMMQRADEALWGTGNGSAIERMARGTTELITNILGYLLFGAVLSFVSPWIMVILTVLPIMNYLVIKSIQKFQYKSRNDTSKLDRQLWYIANNSGSFSAAKDVRIYGMNTWFVNMYKTLTKERLSWDKRFAKKYFVSNIIDAVIILLRDGFAYAILVYMVVDGKITVDNFILYFAAVGGFSGWIGGIVGKFNEINDISLYACDLRDYLNYPEKTNRSDNSIKINFDKPCDIVIENLCYRYEGSDKDILSDISIKIKAGEKIAIVGLNGAGKTTLIKNICGLYNPTSGRIYVNGHNKDEYNIYDYYSMFATVFQDYHFLPVSIANTVSSRTDENTDRNKVVKCLDLAGLSKKVSELENSIDSMLNKQLNESGVDLSGGEKQKLLLARAIYKNAPVLILDEPTAALDPIAEKELYQKYNELTKNKTSVYISHRLSSTRFCDRILYLENGKIVESGTHNELIQKGGKYAELFKIQSLYYNGDNNGGADNE